MDQAQLVDLLERSGRFLRNGHFKLVSGKHSDSYVQTRMPRAGTADSRRRHADRVITSLVSGESLCFPG